MLMLFLEKYSLHNSENSTIKQLSEKIGNGVTQSLEIFVDVKQQQIQF
jgi:hypothetical protein